MALTGTSTAASCAGKCPCLQRTRARTTSFWNRPWIWQGLPHCCRAGGEGEVMETIPGAFLHLSTGQRWSVAVTLPSAGEHGQSQAAGQDLQREPCWHCQGKVWLWHVVPSRAKSPSRAPLGVFGPDLCPVGALLGETASGRGSSRGKGRDTTLQLNRHPVMPSWSFWGWGGGQRAPC